MPRTVHFSKKIEFYLVTQSFYRCPLVQHCTGTPAAACCTCLLIKLFPRVITERPNIELAP
jgi:hypothetical protein